MIVESEEVTDAMPVLFAGIEDVIFRFCTIKGFHADGGHASGAFLSCTLNNLDIYWGLFNECLFAGCCFENCTFRGTGFPGCCFVECEFIGCNFIKDNLGGECSFDEARWYGCKQLNSVGMPIEVK